MTESSVIVPVLGERVARQGNRFTRWICTQVLRLFGWKMRGTLPNREKFIAVVAPHTTGWDFAIGMLCIQAMGIRLWWMGADWVVRIPFVKSLGGISIDRSQRHGVVDQTIQQFLDNEHMVMVIAPEGSRKKVRWKSGFHHIAKGAGVPLVLVGVSYQGRFVDLSEPLDAGETVEETYAKLTPYFQKFADEYPDRFSLPTVTQ